MVRKNVRNADGRETVAYHLDLHGAQTNTPMSGQIPSGTECHLISDSPDPNGHAKMLYQGQHVFVRKRHIHPSTGRGGVSDMLDNPNMFAEVRNQSPQETQVPYYLTVDRSFTIPAGYIQNGEQLEYDEGDYTEQNFMITLKHRGQQVLISSLHIEVDDDAALHPRYAAKIVEKAKQELSVLAFPPHIINELDSEAMTRLQHAAKNDHAQQAKDELNRAGPAAPLYLVWPCPMVAHAEDRNLGYCQGVEDLTLGRMERHGMCAIHFAARNSGAEVLDVLLEEAGANCMHYLAQTDKTGANTVDLLCKETDSKKDNTHNDYARCMDVVFKHIQKVEPAAVDYFFKRHTQKSPEAPKCTPSLAEALRLRGNNFFQIFTKHVHPPLIAELLSAFGKSHTSSDDMPVIFAVFARSESKPSESENARTVLDTLLRACPQPLQVLKSIKCKQQGSTCLHKAMATKNGLLTGVVLQHAGDNIPGLLQAQDKKLNTPLHEAIRKECFDGLDMALAQLSPENLSILMLEGEGHLTIAQLCANEGETERPREGVGRDMFGFRMFGLVGFHDDFDDLGGREREPNPLFIKMMGSILKVDEGKSEVILGAADRSGLTPFHYAAMRGNVRMLELMKAYLDKNTQPEEVKRILSLKDSMGKTATDVAKKTRVGRGRGHSVAPQPQQALGPPQKDAFEYLEQFVPPTPKPAPAAQNSPAALLAQLTPEDQLRFQQQPELLEQLLRQQEQYDNAASARRQPAGRGRPHGQAQRRQNFGGFGLGFLG